MKTLRSFAQVAAVTFAIVTALAFGCQKRSSKQPASNTAHVQRDVQSLLDRWVHAFAARDVDAVRSVLAGDDRFVWLEDGEPRYQSADDVVRALASFPPNMTFSHTLGNARIVPISDDAAWAQLAATTQIKLEDRVVSNFNSVVLMVVQREQSGWRIIAAHTSTSKPRPPLPA